MKKLFALFVCMTLTCISVAGSENFNPSTQTESYSLDANTLKNSIVTVPAGLTFRGVFLNPVSTETATTGQEVNIALINDFYYKDKKIAPAGSNVIGTVIETSRAKHGSINGKLTLRFTHIITPSGLDIPISATIRTPDKTGVILGGSNLMINAGGRSVPETASARSAYVPTYTGVSAGTAAAMNTAIETNGGSLLKSIWDKGIDVEISANTTVELILTQPITVTPTDK